MNYDVVEQHTKLDGAIYVFVTYSRWIFISNVQLF